MRIGDATCIATPEFFLVPRPHRLGPAMLSPTQFPSVLPSWEVNAANPTELSRDAFGARTHFLLPDRGWNSWVNGEWFLCRWGASAGEDFFGTGTRLIADGENCRRASGTTSFRRVPHPALPAASFLCGPSAPPLARALSCCVPRLCTATLFMFREPPETIFPRFPVSRELTDLVRCIVRELGICTRDSCTAPSERITPSGADYRLGSSSSWAFAADCTMAEMEIQLQTWQPRPASRIDTMDAWHFAQTDGWRFGCSPPRTFAVFGTGARPTAI
ncbi:hypothetical protein K438DRAFT_1782165 [Mycena galopus ATCC 62051]|nr:hypothetical protein K438DRAFT_1782165 [Mycena galopus ATCC 62051]